MGGRAVWKGPFFQSSLLDAIRTARRAAPTKGPDGTLTAPAVRVTARNNTILPAFVGARLLVHNGRDYVPLTVREEMVGCKLSEFVLTTKPFSYRATNANRK